MPLSSVSSFTFTVMVFPVSDCALLVSRLMYLRSKSAPINVVSIYSLGRPLDKSPQTHTCSREGRLAVTLSIKASIPDTLRTMEVKSEVSGWELFTE